MRVRVPQACHPLFTLLATEFGRTCRKWKEKSLAMLLTYTIFRQNLDCEQSLFFSQLAASPLAPRRLAITNRALPSTIPKKNNNCSQSRQNYVHFVFNPVCVVLATYFACFLFSWGGPLLFELKFGEGHNF